jgi:ribosomal protein L30E
MAKKADVMTVEFRKLIAAGRVVVGSKQVLQQLRLGGLERVFVAKNCPDRTRKSLEYYKSLQVFDLVRLEVLSDELGAMCKKQFVISVLGVRK